MGPRAKYLQFLQALCATYLQPFLKPTKYAYPSSIPHKNKEILTVLIDELRFKDDSRLRIVDTIKESYGEIQHIQFSYEYTRPSGFFFSFQKEESDQPSSALRVWKPNPHLHVGIMRIVDGQQRHSPSFWDEFPDELIEHNGPHFKSADITVKEFIAIILMNFFKDDSDATARSRLLTIIGYPENNTSNP